jgi:aromatic ring-cleaving dioxygenase
MNVYNYYHGHFYFTAETMTSAELIRQKMTFDLPQLFRVFPFVPRPVGPHPFPMFEFHFRGSDLQTVRTWLEKNRAGHSVLLHPLTGDEIEDHTVFAEFVGEPVTLNIGFLKAL